jgi:hypothetical protein
MRHGDSTWCAVLPFRAMSAAPPPGPVAPATSHITRCLLAARSRAQLRRDDDPPPGPARTSSLAYRVEAEDQADQPELCSFAPDIRRDPARRHRLAQPGLQLSRREGQHHKVLMIKRHIYPCANFAVTRKRVTLGNRRSRNRARARKQDQRRISISVDIGSACSVY